MSTREKFKRFKGKLRAKLGIEVTQTNSESNLSLRAQSHSPVPRSGPGLISSRVEPQARAGNENVQPPTPSNVDQVLGTSDLHTETVTHASHAQEISSKADLIIKSSVEAGNNTTQATCSIPDIQVNPPILAPISTPISRSSDDSQNAALQSVLALLGSEVPETTKDSGAASLASLPSPNQIPVPAQGTRSNTPTMTDRRQNALPRATISLSSVSPASLDSNTAPPSLSAGGRDEKHPFDTNLPPQLTSTIVDATPNPRTEPARPEKDAQAASQIITSTLGSTHEDAGSMSLYGPSPLDCQTTLPIVTTPFQSEATLRGTNFPEMSTALPTKTKSTVTDSAWKSFNGFRKVLGSIVNEVGPLKLVMDELGGLISVYEDTATARTDYAVVRAELEELFGTLSTHFSGNVPPAMTAGINNLCTAIESELNQISTKEDRRTARRLVEANQDLDEVVQCYRRIKGHLKRLNLNVDLSIWKTVDEQASENRLKSLTPSLSACYNSAEALQVGRRECTPDTRKQVLADLSHWRHDKNRENMYWLNGMAGTGKTTIAGSLCAMLDKSHELGASYFCTRLLPECRNVKLILPTIAYQLARLCRPFYYALSMALQVDPDLYTKALPIQLQGLIVEPLCKVAPALPEHLVIVIDALDECEDGQAVGLLLEILAKKATDLPLKIFVSSRPEPQIREMIGETRSKLILHELEASIVKQDIKLYLQTELSGLSTLIAESELAGLVERAGVLFIYAATVVRYIKSVSSSSHRQRRVREVLKVKSSGLARTNQDIDALYGAILASAFNDSGLDDEDIKTMRLVLDTVVCAQEPLTVSGLAGLLEVVDASSVEDALAPLWSVLHISSASKLVTTLHASFPDYMLDRTRSRHYGCQSDIHHGNLAELCFDRVDRNESQFNICGLESSYVLDDDVQDLDKRVQAAIPQDLWYACRYWAAHLRQGGPSAERVRRVANFVADRLLLWMEVLNLKKQINVGALIFEGAERWYKEQSAPQEMKELIHDAWRFITMFATNDVSQSTAHLYISMLAVWPNSESGIGHYVQRTKGLKTVGGSGMTRRQLAHLGVFSAKGLVASLAFSPDGMRIVSGCLDRTIRVWDAQTGEAVLHPLRGHTLSVRSVAFSPDGMRIGSGSDDATVRMWDAQVGVAILSPFRGHTERVNSVVFSSDGKLIVSGSFDMTIRVWDAETGKALLGPLRGHTDSVTSVAFSPDGMRIISGSGDKTIRVWDMQTATALLDPLKGHIKSVNSVAFSPDGTRIVSGSSDKTIRVWDARTGKALLDPLEGHTSSVRSVSFSPDGMRIVSGSRDNTIRVWDTQPDMVLLDPFRAHTDSVNSVAFSPDGMRIVSGSDDKTIRVWDAQTDKALLHPLEGHTSSVRSVAFSPDGMRIASGSVDKTIRVWDAQTGKALLHPLEGHTDLVDSVAFSPDSMRIVSGSPDMTIRLWDAQTGEALLHPLSAGSHRFSAKSVAFSPDGMYVVSDANNSKGVQVWNAQTGEEILHPLDALSDLVNSVVISPDGTRIIPGTYGPMIRVKDAQSGKVVLGPLKGHSERVNSIVFSPDGMRIISGSNDKTIRVWDSQTGRALLSPLNGHTDSVNSVAFSPDGMRAVSGSDDSTIRMWNLEGLIGQSASAMQPSEIKFPRWTLDERGWVRDQAGRPLLWLPSDLHDRLVLSSMLFLISSEGSVELDFHGAKIGESWVDCYVPCPRI